MLVNTYKKFNVDQRTIETSSMANLIEMIQYISAWNSDPTIRVGNLGAYRNYSYNMIFDTEDIVPESNIFSLKNILFNKSFVNISKQDIFKMFYVFEIPDYSANAATTGMTDFDVECYYRGNKIFQKFIVIMKSFTTKTAYILIDRKMVINNIPSLDIIIEPKVFFNPDAKADSIKTPKILACEKLDETRYCFIIDDEKDKNSSASFITNYMDYDLFFKADYVPTSKKTIGDFYRLSETAYNLRAENILSFVSSYTNFQTYTGSDISEYERVMNSTNSDTSDYKGDYFKQTQMSVLKLLKSVTYNNTGLNNNLLKFTPYIENSPNSTVIIVELSSNNAGSVKITDKNLFLISRQNFKKYNQTTIIKGTNNISLSNLPIFNKLENLELYEYKMNSTATAWDYTSGAKLSLIDFRASATTNGSSVLSSLQLSTTNNNYNRLFEIKVVGDNKRTNNILLPSTFVDNSFDIIGYLKQSKTFRYNINLKKCDIKVFCDGKFCQFNVTDKIVNIIKPSTTNFTEIIVRDYSNTIQSLDDIVNAPDESISNNLISVTPDKSDAMISLINGETVISDPALTVNPDHIILPTELPLTEINEFYPYDGKDKQYVAVASKDEPVIHVTDNIIDIGVAEQVIEINGVKIKWSDIFKKNLTTIQSNSIKLLDTSNLDKYTRSKFIDLDLAQIRANSLKHAHNSTLTLIPATKLNDTWVISKNSLGNTLYGEIIRYVYILITGARAIDYSIIKASTTNVIQNHDLVLIKEYGLNGYKQLNTINKYEYVILPLTKNDSDNIRIELSETAEFSDNIITNVEFCIIT